MILALDSSTSVLSLALGRSQEAAPRRVDWLSTRELSGGGKHGSALPLAIDQLLREAGETVAALSGVAVGLGPGSFTGLRVGLATVKALCYARQLPLAGASSLRALARAALLAGASSPVAALLDARHGELYAGLFEGEGANLVLSEISLPPERLAAALGSYAGTATLVGEGIVAYREALARDFRLEQLRCDLALHPQARQVAELCWPLPAFSFEGLFRVEPSYVRASEPEIRNPGGTFVPREGL